MSSVRYTGTEGLLDFNQQVLDQALALVGAHSARGAAPLSPSGTTAPMYADVMGRHLRHVIEHYEALVQGLHGGRVNYDARARDPDLEARPALAWDRLVDLRQTLSQWTAEMLTLPVQVLGQGGMVGDFQFSVASTAGRELAFLASHAVHHFALMAPHLLRLGVAVPAHFGKAPATVANELSNRSPVTQPNNLEPT